MWHIGELLIQKKLITWNQLQEALKEQQQTKELTGEILLRKRYISAILLYRTLAEQHGMKFVDLSRTRVNPKAVEKVPKEIAEKFTLMPIELHQETMTLALGTPGAYWPEKELKQMTQIANIRPVLCIPEHIKKAIDENYG